MSTSGRQIVTAALEDTTKVIHTQLLAYLNMKDYSSVEACLSILKTLQKAEWLARRERHHVSGYELS